jgi:hypothetical protein
LVTQQIEHCWNIPGGAKGVDTLFAKIRIDMNADATVRGAQIVDHNNLQFAESARRAVLSPLCKELRLPLDKYAGASGWNVIDLTFTPKGIQ